jgi:hypothetical protein
MSLIKPRTRGKHMVRFVTRLDRENHETLHAYAQFLNEPAEYVLNELIDSVLAKDKDFAKWRSEHPDSCVPHPAKRRVRRTSRTSGPNGKDGDHPSRDLNATSAGPATRV